jgi:hypothetical protein
MPPGGPEEEPDSNPLQGMTATEHIQEAMKHLMMALATEGDDQRGHGILKGMTALQGILGGEAKKNAQLAQLGG